MTPEIQINGRDASAPEPRMTLKWTANQLKTAMDEADVSIEQLMGSMTGLFASIRKIAEHTADTAVQGENAPVQKNDVRGVDDPAAGLNAAAITRYCDEAESQLQASIVALQFYDRLVQRVEHVQHSLNFVADDIMSPQSKDITDWHELFARLDSMYSEDQKQRINLDLNPNPSAHTPVPAAQPPAVTVSDIELF